MCDRMCHQRVRDLCRAKDLLRKLKEDPGFVLHHVVVRVHVCAQEEAASFINLSLPKLLITYSFLILNIRSYSNEKFY